MQKRALLRPLAVLALSLISFAAAVWAVDWPQWRGPARDGLAVGVQPPRTFPKQLSESWSVEVGLGHSSPVVVGDRVYVFSRQAEQEVVACLRLADGRQIWRKDYPAPYEVNPAAIAHGPGPKATPVIAGERLFTFGISGILTAWDAGSGKQLWQKAFGRQFATTSPLYGVASSPIVDGDSVIVFVGGPDQGALIALHVATGSLRWSWDGDGPGYASPVIANLSGSRQVITQSQTACVGLDADSGELLWKLPFHTDYDQNSVTPVVYKDSVVFSGLNRGVARYRIEKQKDRWRTDKIWENKDVSLYMSSPVLSGDRLYGFSHRQKGQLFALDLTTGKTLWTGEGRMAENTALIRTGKVLWALTTESDLVAFADSPSKYTEIARYKVASSPTWAHPALTGFGVLVKDESKLIYWLFREPRSG